MSVWEDHRVAYEAHLAADAAAYEANLALDNTRKAIIAYLGKKVSEEPGYTANSTDALNDFVTAAESRHAKTLGAYKPRKPLQIEVVNPRSVDTGEPMNVGLGQPDMGGTL